MLEHVALPPCQQMQPSHMPRLKPPSVSRNKHRLPIGTETNRLNDIRDRSIPRDTPDTCGKQQRPAKLRHPGKHQQTSIRRLRPDAPWSASLLR